MNIMPNAELFQAQLYQYVYIYTPDFWPVWLILAGILFAGMLGVLTLHGLLRYKLAPPHACSHEEKVYLYSRAIRLWHWSNATLFILLLASGLLNHFAVGSVKDTMTLVALHEACGYLLLISWAAFILINAFGGNGHHYLIERNNWGKRAFLQVRFYLYGIIRGEDHPFPATPRAKFNPLQQAAYLGVMYALLPALLATGLLLSNPLWLPADVVLVKAWLLPLHLLLAVASLFFLCGHIYLCTTGRTPTQTFRCMIDGYHRH